MYPEPELQMENNIQMEETNNASDHIPTTDVESAEEQTEQH